MATLSEIMADSIKKVPIDQLGPGFSIFGNKGAVWTDSAHAYKSGRGNMCGTPALSSNHARMADITMVGCERCIAALKEEGII